VYDKNTKQNTDASTLQGFQAVTPTTLPGKKENTPEFFQAFPAKPEFSRSPTLNPPMELKEGVVAKPTAVSPRKSSRARKWFDTGKQQGGGAVIAFIDITNLNDQQGLNIKRLSEQQNVFLKVFSKDVFATNGGAPVELARLQNPQNIEMNTSVSIDVGDQIAREFEVRSYPLFVYMAPDGTESRFNLEKEADKLTAAIKTQAQK
jgi:hypothetical protein